MADYTITLDANPQQVLQAFRQIEQQAKTSGESAGKKLAEGLQGFSSNSITALQQNLNRLQQRQLKVDVDSRAFVSLGGQIRQVQQQLSDLEKRRIEVDTKPVVDNFRLLDGVVQGVAFSLSNAVVGGAQQALSAIGGLINGYARLDTVIRQAAAASGGPGDYDKLAATIDRVGIDAAGTSEQVAALSLELARGGMTADQQARSLSGIVRGAEATATAYDRMGQIVSATLTSFGLDAGETTRVVDALVQGANASATDVSGLGEAFKLSAPAAKLLGVNVEGLATAVGLFTNAGITAGEAGTALRNGLSQLAQAAPKSGRQLQGLTGQAKVAAETVKRLGLDIYTASGQLKPMEEVLLQVKRAMSGMTSGEQTMYASQLFGGLDDAAKWLAVIGQSEEKIRTMAASMANSAGATDRNRDAMQGFEMTVKQLGGTVDSLGKQVGTVAAAGLLPLVQAANSLVGAVSGLPAPVKQTAIALSLLTGAVVGATTAYVVFKKVLAVGAISDTISEIANLTKSIGGKLKAGIDLAIAAWPGFIAQTRAAGTAQIGLIASLKATAAAIKLQFIAATESAKAAIIGFIGYLKSVSFAQFIAGARAAIVALAPMAAAIGALIGAVLIWRQTLAGSDEVQQKFAGTQEETKAALDRLKQSLGVVGADIEQVKRSADNARNGFVQFWNSLREPMAMREATNQVLQLQASWHKAFEAANRYARSIKDGPTLTDKNSTSAVAYAKALQSAADISAKRATSLRNLADQAEAAGRYREAGNLSRNADTLDRDAKSYSNLKTAIEQKLGTLEREILLSREQQQALEARKKAEQDLNAIIAEAPIRRLDEQVKAGQQLLNIAQAIGQAEQSRFGIISAGLNYELQKAQERGESELVIKDIKDKIAAKDREALKARYQALLQEQKLQTALLALQQRRAEMQGQLDVTTQRVAILNAENNLRKANAEYGASSDQAIEASKTLEIQRQMLELRTQSLEFLRQSQPLEREALRLQQETATNAIRADAVSKGMAPEAGSFRQAQTVTTLKDGTIEIRQNWEYVANSANAIDRLNLGGQFGTVATNTQAAARAAQDFYGFLRSAASLPQARWAGGPVEAGGEYRINELGQEAFLSAGRLSMIDAPANSIWRAPSEGVVIPAGITARLQGRTQATISHGGISGGTAELAIEVGKLRQEVGNLARRDWSVHVTQRTGPTGSQVMRTLLR